MIALGILMVIALVILLVIALVILLVLRVLRTVFCHRMWVVRDEKGLEGN